MILFTPRALVPFFILSAATGTHVPPGSTVPAERPTLVVLITIDQMRGDYLDKFAPQWTGAFRRFRDHAAFFPNGQQNHALTETAPGHSTLLSGREPVHNGIFSNDRGVPDPTTTLIGAAGVGASPRRFIGTTLYDWMRARDTAARVLSVSRKDRAAILPVGRARSDVYWLGGGRFTTSSYYRDTLPTWVLRFDDEMSGERLPAEWRLLLADSAYREPDDQPFEHGGKDVTFPHSLGATPAERVARLEESPWMDSLTLALALRGAHELRLGTRNTPDLLAVSLSTLDKIGHTYGPDSREIHDHLLRLDRWLAVFLDSLATAVPAARTIVVVSADHGVVSMPEYVTTVQHAPGGRVDPGPVARTAGATLRDRFGVDFDLVFDNGMLTADTDALRARGVSIDSLANTLASQIKRMTGVAKTYTPRQLAAAPATDIAATRWRNNLAPGVGWLLATVAAPGYVFSDKLTAEHGTMHPQTVNVPIIFLGPTAPAGRYPRSIRTVDIAPTLAALIGVPPTERLDGVVLRELVVR